MNGRFNEWRYCDIISTVDFFSNMTTEKICSGSRNSSKNIFVNQINTYTSEKTNILKWNDIRSRLCLQQNLLCRGKYIFINVLSSEIFYIPATAPFFVVSALTHSSFQKGIWRDQGPTTWTLPGNPPFYLCTICRGLYPTQQEKDTFFSLAILC